MPKPRDPQRDAEFRKLHAQGLDRPGIAKAMGITVNAVSGLAHKLKLKFRHKVAKEPPPVRHGIAGTPPVLTELLTFASAAVPALPVVPKPKVPTTGALRSPRTCCWPFGDPPNIRWCDQEATFGPYCDDHAQRAYVSKRVAA